MNTMIQIRNVPEEFHRRLKARAALEGMSMSNFIRRELDRALARPNRQELLARVAALPLIEVDPSPGALIREERDAW